MPMKFLIFILFFCSLSCHDDKFWGYNYDADLSISSATISGTVTNIFTDQPVHKAKIQIGNHLTSTDIYGEYILEYILTEDDERDRKVTIQIEADRYFPYAAQKIIYPTQTELNFTLEYAAPIIKATGCYLQTYCQAIVLDYQGVDDIEKVSARFVYYDTTSNTISHQFEKELTRKQIVTENLAYYQTEVNPITAYGILGATYTIRASDKSGYFTEIDHTNNSFAPDTLLFTP
jgi:hypothetical protein